MNRLNCIGTVDSPKKVTCSGKQGEKTESQGDWKQRFICNQLLFCVKLTSDIYILVTYRALHKEGDKRKTNAAFALPELQTGATLDEDFVRNSANRKVALVFHLSLIL